MWFGGARTRQNNPDCLRCRAALRQSDSVSHWRYLNSDAGLPWDPECTGLWAGVTFSETPDSGDEMRKEDSFSGFLLTSDSCCYVALTPFLWKTVQRSKSPGHLHPASRFLREPTLPSDDFPLLSCASWPAPLPGCCFSLSPQILFIRLSKFTKELQENLVNNVKMHNLTSSHGLLTTCCVYLCSCSTCIACICMVSVMIFVWLLRFLGRS